jgi:type IV secretion system protein VirB9
MNGMLRKFNFSLIIFFVLNIMISANSFAVITPKPMATDKRLRVIVYNPNEIFVYKGFYGYQSSIVFAPDETIETISMGDTTAWQILPSGNRLFIKPIEGDAQTNMLLITNKREYHFILEAAEAIDINDPGLVFSVSFIYPGDTGGDDLQSFNNIVVDDNNEDSNYNYNYTISGPEFMSPLQIFDDGEFTYFVFRDKNATIPAFFSVDDKGLESIINYKLSGKYLIVEAVYKKMTLRNGDDVVCVYNEDFSSQTGTSIIAKKKNLAKQADK